jgi:hypothetical protein
MFTRAQLAHQIVFFFQCHSRFFPISIVFIEHWFVRLSLWLGAALVSFTKLQSLQQQHTPSEKDDKHVYGSQSTLFAIWEQANEM